MKTFLFMHVFKHNGLPKDILYDQDPKLKNKFCCALWKRMGLELMMNAFFQPHTNGQIKIVNFAIQQFLKNYVAMDKLDWVDHLVITSHNF
jgi:hypothetical protein